VKTLALLGLGFFALGNAVAPPARMQVVAREFSYQLSRTQLKPGTAVIELANFGQDAHDLRVQRVGAAHIAGTRVVQAGGRADLTVKLRPGKYRFWCSLADHRARGMSATVVVR
jgi:plastocyanin